MQLSLFEAHVVPRQHVETLVMADRGLRPPKRLATSEGQTRRLGTPWRRGASGVARVRAYFGVERQVTRTTYRVAISPSGCRVFWLPPRSSRPGRGRWQHSGDAA